MFRSVSGRLKHDTSRLSTVDCDSVQRSTRALLLINADNATAWNARKRLLSVVSASSSASASAVSATEPTTGPAAVTAAPSTSTAPLLAELSFLSFLFSKHPKSAEAWAHRRWTAQRLIGSAVQGEVRSGWQDDTGAIALLALLRSELAVVEMTAERYPKNYHAWLYRQWIVQQVDTQRQQTSTHSDTDAHTQKAGGPQRWLDVLGEEKRRIGAWNESHMSDHSGWHYRSFLTDRMLAAPSLHTSPLSLLTAELSYLSSLQLLYPAHESAWAYRRYILHAAISKHTHSDDDRQQWRHGEERWCDEREALGCCASEDEWMLERRYARVHRLYVTELMAVQRAQQSEGDSAVADALTAMQEPERTRWSSAVACVQQVYPRQVWADRAALVT